MMPKPRFLLLLLSCLLPAPVQAQPAVLEPVTIRAASEDDTTSTLTAETLARQRALGDDSAALLDGLPGVSLYGAGGLSSLPVIRGLADERLRVQVNGMDLMAACPNHMNPALSYIDPASVERVRVFAGITPVSVGGDSIGGSIQLESAPPQFARTGQTSRHSATLGSSYQSNGHAWSVRASANLATAKLAMRYDGASRHARNYTAARAFKAATRGREGGPVLPGNEVGSSAYDANNHALTLAWRHQQHLLELALARQNLTHEGFPNQRMDMTANQDTQVRLRYQGRLGSSKLQAQVWQQNTGHKMDMGADRHTYGSGMPMHAKAYTSGLSLQAERDLSARDSLRLGAEYHRHILYDWWPAVGGAMGPNDFWNIDYGRRQRLGAFAEWERQWQTRWSSLLGVRLSTVRSNAAAVQGYNNGMAALWGNDAAAFNARAHKHRHSLLDFSALLRYEPRAGLTLEGGYARKTRAPSLYQHYPWSTQAMAALMNNFAGDGNGYIGNDALKPETAHTISLGADWRDTDSSAARWSLKGTLHHTRVRGYIDARRCDFGQCSAANQTTQNGFVLLQYVNQSARLYGGEISGHFVLGKSARHGTLRATGSMNYLRARNTRSGDNLYQIMPLDIRLGLQWQHGGWTHNIEAQRVGAKRKVSQVRNEIATAAYHLINLHSSRQWRRARLDVSVDNLLNRFYAQPLGGAYLGQGASMSSSGIAWGVPVPGKGRSLNLALEMQF